MDIRDVEAVIVNGPPDTLAQLYQVIIIVNKTHIVVFIITKYGSTLYIGMDEVLAHYACTFEISDLHFHFQ